jgi:hypothetical protein
LPFTPASHALKIPMTGLVGLLPVVTIARGARVVGSTLLEITTVRIGTCAGATPGAAPSGPVRLAPGVAGAHAATVMASMEIKLMNRTRCIDTSLVRIMPA